MPKRSADTPKRVKPPPAPRRRPRQDRSQATVDAIVEACVLILDQEGPECLTTNRIAERSGVAKGSLYQYFPNKEAIVSAAFDRILTTDLGLRDQQKAEWASLSLEDSVAFLVDHMLERDRRLARLHQSFYQTYHRNFDLGLEMERSRSDADLIVGAVRDRLVEHRHRVRAIDLDTAAFLLARGLRGLVWKVIEERPESLESEALRDELVSLFLSYLIQPERT